MSQRDRVVLVESATGSASARHLRELTMSNALLRKWRRWLDRILNEQLWDLLVHQHMFGQLRECTAPYAGTYRSANLAQWMRQGYVAFAATTIRRMLEEPWKPPVPKKCRNCGAIVRKPKRTRSLSLVILLRDIEQNASLFTREWFRTRYRNPSLRRRFADRDFNTITRSRTANVLSPSRVARDIKTLRRTTAPLRRLVDKAIAHTDRDRRKIGRPKFKHIDEAVTAILETYRRYSLLIRGGCLHPIVPLQDYDIVADLKRIWPERPRGWP